MATTDDQTTDRHDESNTAQFNDDPHNLKNTPFEETTCNTCGTYVVKAHNYQGPTRCLECHRTHHKLTWQSGSPIGPWHPTTGYTPTPQPQPHKPPTPKTEWQWACIECHTIHPAHNQTDANNQLRHHHQTHHPPTRRTVKEFPRVEHR